VRQNNRVIIIGAGVGGLATALALAAQGLEVKLFERAASPGGKMREVVVDGHPIDAGPTVFTMRWVFEELFASCGTSLESELGLSRAQVLARHAWSDRERLDLFADVDRSADAVARFSGLPERARFLAFSKDASNIYRTLEGPFISSSRTNPLGLTARARRSGVLRGMWQINPYTTLWQALGKHFRDPRLQQLFGRYATYAGSSPFLSPATLMLIAHVEQEGVWLVDGGMHQLAVAMARLAQRNGAEIHYGAEVAEIMTRHGRAAGILLKGKDSAPIEADAVIVNADISAVGTGLFGAAVARAVTPTPPKKRSLSALTWNVVAETAGFPLNRHSVFFSSDYAREFREIFDQGRLPSEPTVYICAQDRDALTGEDEGEPPTPTRERERLLLLVNAPAVGDRQTFTEGEVQACKERTFKLLGRCGLDILHAPDGIRATAPDQFEGLFPATGGALYGRASHGWQSSFARPGARTKVPRLYLAGGSTHPGAGVPMAALSGRQAAAAVLADLAKG
jgi:1-hydroxycarotenoid 3,4-desaturase